MSSETVQLHYFKRRLRKELKLRAEHYRTLKEDPHGIGTAVYVVLLELEEILAKINVADL